MEEYYFDLDEVVENDKVFVLIIYDIVDNKRRVKLAKFLQGYGFRVQKSAFEAIIPKEKYNKLLREIGVYATKNDSIKVYKIIGKGQVTTFGTSLQIEDEDVIVI